MALTQEQEALIATKFATFTEEEKQLLSTASTSDLSEGTSKVIISARSQSMVATLESLISGQVSSFAVLQQVADASDGATLYPALDSFQSELESGDDPNAALRAAVWVTLSALAHFRRS